MEEDETYSPHNFVCLTPTPDDWKLSENEQECIDNVFGAGRAGYLQKDLFKLALNAGVDNLDLAAWIAQDIYRHLEYNVMDQVSLQNYEMDAEMRGKNG